MGSNTPPPLDHPVARNDLLLAMIVIITGACLAAFIALTLLANKQLTAFEEAASEVQQRLQETSNTSSQILHSVAAIHQASERDRVHRQFAIYAKGVAESYPFVQALGRYDQLDKSQTQDFQSVLQHYGVFTETTRVRSDDGQPLQSDRQRFNPIVNVHPPASPLYELIGVDLQSNPKLSRRLDAAAAQNQTTVIGTPKSWPLSNRGMLIAQPTYRGHYPPVHPIDRLDQTDGGYWLALNTQQILNHSRAGEETLSATLFIYQSDTEHPIAAATVAATTRPNLHFSNWFSPFVTNREIHADIGTMRLSLTSPSGLSEKELSIIIATFSAAILFFSLAFFLRILRNSSEMQIEYQERALVHERERALVTLQSIGDGVITTDAEGTIDYFNPAADQILAGSGAQLIGEKLSEALIFSASADANDEQFTLKPSADRSSNNKNVMLSLLGQDMPVTVVDTILSPLTDSHGKHSGSVLAIRDVTPEYKLAQELEYQARHDKLTRLANRSTFERALARLIAEARAPNGRQHAICYVDLDQFKLINDTCSHAAGDLLLARLARELATQVRAGDLLARLGGDEFGLLICNCSAEQAEALANRLHAFFQDYLFSWENKVFKVHASIGLVHINGQHKNINEALSEVDLACYSAKDAGRNILHVYDPGDEQTRARYGEMLSMPVLHQALRDDSFTLFVQPIATVSPASGDEPIQHHEVLLRLVSADGEIVSPFRFILAAERYDMMRSIDRWVVNAAMQEIAIIQNTSLRHHRFSINLSGQTMVDASVAEYISSCIDVHGVDPAQLCFEITETSVIGNFDQALALIDHLHNLGCTIALDDFGAGVSSFGYLKKLPVDYLKIDGQFVREMANNNVDHEMVQSIHKVGQALNVKTVAEFVETAEIMDALRELNIDYAQGYHISPPMPFDQLLQYAKVQQRAA